MKIQSSFSRRVMTGLAVTLLFFLASPLFAEENRAQAKRHFDRAVTFLESESLTEAAAEFETSIALYPTKSGIYNLANCYRGMARHEDALRMFKRLLAEYDADLDKETRADVTLQIDELEILTADTKTETAEPRLQTPVDGYDSPDSQPNNQRIFRIIRNVGIAGTVLFGGLSIAFWGVTAAKKQDYEKQTGDFNQAVDDGTYDLTLSSDLESATSKRAELLTLGNNVTTMNGIAVGMTVAAGLFGVATVFGVLKTRHTRETKPVEVSMRLDGLQLRF